MSLDEYQQKAYTTCLKESDNHSYMKDGLTEETGELNGVFAKALRKGQIIYLTNGNVKFTGTDEERAQFKEKVLKELGDVLWMVAGLATSFGWSLESVAYANLMKLADRKNKNTITEHTDH